MRDWIRIVVRFLLDSRRVRRLGGILPQRLRKHAASTLGRLDAEQDRQLDAVAQCLRSDLLTSSLKETTAWKQVRTRADWEAFRDVRLDALRRSLGGFPPAPPALRVRTTHTRRGDGFYTDNLVFESRAGLVVTANLYRPSDPAEASPGILISHSHHYAKTQEELQTMGATWARCGCVVLVMDQLGHGERRQHPFHSAADYPGRFPVGRQDYFFRYNVGIQLHLIGDSLIGWMVWDLMRGVDLLLSRPGVDPARIILIGSVAGGGDPAAVAAALDDRIAAVVPFGFGKAQIQRSDSGVQVDYAGHGSWESTRNLRLSARDGFAPWLILGAIAERRLVYAHEFGWDSEQDPVWKRLEEIYELYGAPDHLAAVHGSGSGRSREDTHCDNVGAIHRRQIYPLLERWFEIPPPIQECRPRRPEQELLCLTPEPSAQSGARAVHQLAAELAAERLARARKRLSGLGALARRVTVREDFARWIGAVLPAGDPRVTSRSRKTVKGIGEERVVLETEPGVTVSSILLTPKAGGSVRTPVVVGLAQAGSQRLIRGRSKLIAELLQRGVAVCLPELRGTGDSRRGDEFRGRRSAATTVSSSELMLGRTLLGARLRDLRSILRYLRTRSMLDARRIALWGDSFAPPNPSRRNLAVPFDGEPFPALCEPVAGILALLGGLFEEGICAVVSCGGLTSFESLLEGPFCYVPHDVIVPGLLEAGDLCDVAAALAPLPLRMEALVDGLNRRVAADSLARTFQQARAAYSMAGAAGAISVEVQRGPAPDTAHWISRSLRADRTPSSSRVD